MPGSQSNDPSRIGTVMTIHPEPNATIRHDDSPSGATTILGDSATPGGTLVVPSAVPPASPASPIKPSNKPLKLPTTNPSLSVGNIENALVEDDPRLWSSRRKLTILAIISFAALAPTTGAFIYQPAIQTIQKQLHATTSEIALSLSLFILVQGNFPLIWASISEIKGRKFVYILSMVVFIVGSAIGGASKHISVLICMRMFQAAGSSAVLAIGAGTLADIYAPKERGTMMGIYYAAPLLGPALGPILGGILAQVWSWRATFYFLTIIGGVVLLSLFLFKDTFRRERSLTYQSAKRHAIHRAKEKARKVGSDDQAEKGGRTPVDAAMVKVTLVDLNPFKPIWSVLKRKNNLSTLFPSSLLFALQYSIAFTTARTFAASPYNYGPLKLGLVLLSFGVGCMGGSVIGGRWSDRTFAKLKKNNGGESWPEMRLKSTRVAMIFLPPAVLAFAWTCEKHTNVAGPVVCLFVTGFSVLFIYSSTLAYIVDANAGRSTAAVASNSSFRGLAGMVASEIAAPLQDAMGDGGLYSLWAGILLIMEAMILLVIWKGKEWREEAENNELLAAWRRDHKGEVPVPLIAEGTARAKGSPEAPS